MRIHLQPPADANLAIAYVIEVLLRTRETLVTAFYDTPADLRDPARKDALRAQYRELSVAIEQLRPATAPGQ